MENYDLNSIINEYYDTLLKKIGLEFEKVKNDSDSEIILTKIDNDYLKIVEEINNTRKINIHDLETHKKEFDLLMENFCFDKDLKLRNVRKKLFERNFCFFIPLSEISSEKSLSVLFLMPMFLDEDEIKMIGFLLFFFRKLFPSIFLKFYFISIQGTC